MSRVSDVINQPCWGPSDDDDPEPEDIEDIDPIPEDVELDPEPEHVSNVSTGADGLLDVKTEIVVRGNKQGYIASTPPLLDRSSVPEPVEPEPEPQPQLTASQKKRAKKARQRARQRAEEAAVRDSASHPGGAARHGGVPKGLIQGV
jgi:hypothetical protein